MPEYSGFFGAKKLEDGTYDRVYSEIHFAKLFSMFYKNGIFFDDVTNLQVVAKSGLIVTVKAGRAFIDGYWYELDEDMDIVLDVNTTSYAINCSITCTLDRAERKISIVKKQPVTSLLPINDNNKHELVLAVITLGVGVSTITNSVITDYRTNENYCGIVKGTIEQIKTEDLFLQFQAQFTEWFEEVKGVLSGDVAGNLQNQIGVLENLKTEVKSSIVNAINWLRDKLYEIVGDTDISDIGDGTVKGAIAELNRNIKDYIIIKEVTVTITSITGGSEFKSKRSIPQVDGYKPVLASVKGSGHNQIYNYYVSIDNSKKALYTEWRSLVASSVTLRDIQATINVIYTRN